MDTQQLINDAKARFNHASQKLYLKDKYESKLLIADQEGLWKSDKETINFLTIMDEEYLVLLDTFNNPVYVNRIQLLAKLKKNYLEVMQNWLEEYKKTEFNR